MASPTGLYGRGRENALQGKYGGREIMPGAENQTLATCESISSGIEGWVRRQEKRADNNDIKLDKIQNRLPGYAVVIQNLLVAAVSVMATLMVIGG